MELGAHGKTVIVQYCSECHRHASRPGTRLLLGALVGLLGAFSIAGFVPPVWPHLSLATHCALAAVGAAFPIALALFIPRRPSAGHSSAGRAVWWTSEQRIACTNTHWAARVAESSGAQIEVARIREPLPWQWLVTAVLGVFVTVPVFHVLHRPPLRIVNLSQQRLWVTVDDRPLAVVDATSSESPLAGAEVRVPAGRRKLEARTREGRLVSSISATFQPLGEHLYAPGSRDYCFWLETTAYGRTELDQPTLEALSGDDRFWALPAKVDTWFAPNPEPSLADTRSSGGALTALRQARCSAAPPQVRLDGE